MIYEILSINGTVLNTINADLPFMQRKYPDGLYRLVEESVENRGEQEKPTIVITSIEGADLANDITVPVGATLNFTAELRDSNNQLLPVTDVFRLPVKSRDGRERVVLATMTEGVIRFGISFTDSRVWEVTEEVINADLPVDRHMNFAGIRVFVVEP